MNSPMRTGGLVLVTSLLTSLALSPAFLDASTVVEPARTPLTLASPLQDKVFFLLSLLERDSRVYALIEADPALRSLLQAKRDGLARATASCRTDIACITEALRLSEAEQSQASSALRRLYRTSPVVKALTDNELRSSGTYICHDGPGEELLVEAWRDSVRAINHIIDVYGLGRVPRYPNIDSISFDVKSQSYVQLLQTVAANLEEQHSSLTLFFQPSARFALYLLQINSRDEAARHEPLETKDNAAAVRFLRSIDWEEFPYSMIVVPGSGPDRLTWSLSPVCRLRLELATRRYREGKAPLILVSGGYAHPSQTPYAEAIEMKKALIADLGVPAGAILVEPQARHTTTNLRNAARLLYRYGVPFDRKVLITTDEFQSSYIEGNAFASRCEQELGYQPATILRRLTHFDVEATLRVESLQIDWMDPLDP